MESKKINFGCFFIKPRIEMHRRAAALPMQTLVYATPFAKINKFLCGITIYIERDKFWKLQSDDRFEVLDKFIGN